MIESNDETGMYKINGVKRKKKLFSVITIKYIITFVSSFILYTLSSPLGKFIPHGIFGLLSHGKPAAKVALLSH